MHRVGGNGTFAFQFMMTRDEFAQRLDKLRRDGPVFVGCYLLMVAAIIFGFRLLIHGPLGLKIIAIELPLILVIVMAQPFVLKMGVKILLRKQGLLCPACGKPLTKPPLKLEGNTGKCGSCGAVVFED